MVENHNSSALPLMAMKEIPKPHSNATIITALIKDSGKVVGYQLSDGQRLDKVEAVALAKQGGIQGVGISERDGKKGNNLNNIPFMSFASEIDSNM